MQRMFKVSPCEHGYNLTNKHLDGSNPGAAFTDDACRNARGHMRWHLASDYPLVNVPELRAIRSDKGVKRV